MGIFVPGQRAKPRRFQYEPRYYDPKKDESMRRRMRVQSKTRTRRRSPVGLIYFALLLVMILYIYTMVG